jgi:hypothetical protein
VGVCSAVPVCSARVQGVSNVQAAVRMQGTFRTSRSQSRSGKGLSQILSEPMFSSSAKSPIAAAHACSACATTQAHSLGSRTGVSETRTALSPVG